MECFPFGVPERVFLYPKAAKAVIGKGIEGQGQNYRNNNVNEIN